MLLSSFDIPPDRDTYATLCGCRAFGICSSFKHSSLDNNYACWYVDLHSQDTYTLVKHKRTGLKRPSHPEFQTVMHLVAIRRTNS